MVGIYKITNKVDGKVYVGQANDIFRRWREHEKALIKHVHHNYKLQNAFNENGEDINTFEFEILETCDVNDLDLLEIKYMKEYNVLDDKYGYNIRTEGILLSKMVQPKPKTRKSFLIKEELNMYDESFKNMINSNTKVNIYEVLALMWEYYEYIHNEIDKNDINDFFFRDRISVSLSRDMSRCIKYMYLGKDGFFKYTKYAYSGACYYTMKRNHYEKILKEDLYNKWIENIRVPKLKYVRLIEILRLINKLNEYHFDLSSYTVLIYIKIVGLYFLGESFYEYYKLEGICIDELKHEWGKKFNVWAIGGEQ